MTADQLTELVLSQGISAFLLPVSPDGERAVVRFAGEVVPAVRAAVAAARGEAPDQPPADNSVDIMDRVVDLSGRPTVAQPTHVGKNPIGERTAKTLVAVHNQLRAELAQLQQAVAQVLAGRDDPAECLLSHLDYEEEQLLGPLSRHDIEV